MNGNVHKAWVDKHGNELLASNTLNLSYLDIGRSNDNQRTVVETYSQQVQQVVVRGYVREHLQLTLQTVAMAHTVYICEGWWGVTKVTATYKTTV